MLQITFLTTAMKKDAQNVLVFAHISVHISLKTAAQTQKFKTRYKLAHILSLLFVIVLLYYELPQHPQCF